MNQKINRFLLRSKILNNFMPVLYGKRLENDSLFQIPIENGNPVILNKFLYTSFLESPIKGNLIYVNKTTVNEKEFPLEFLSGSLNLKANPKVYNKQITIGQSIFGRLDGNGSLRIELNRPLSSNEFIDFGFVGKRLKYV